MAVQGQRVRFLAHQLLMQAAVRVVVLTTAQLMAQAAQGVVEMELRVLQAAQDQQIRVVAVVGQVERVALQEAQAAQAS